MVQVPDFVKIDTEGLEAAVKKGMSTPAKALSFEYILPPQKDQAIEGPGSSDKLYNKLHLFNICRDETYRMNLTKGWMQATHRTPFSQRLQQILITPPIILN